MKNKKEVHTLMMLPQLFTFKLVMYSYCCPFFGGNKYIKVFIEKVISSRCKARI